MKTIKRLIILAGILIFSLNNILASSDIECLKLKDSNTYRLNFTASPFANNTTAWSPSFYFSEYGVTVDFLVLSNNAIPSSSRSLDEIVIEFEPKGYSLTFLCSAKGMHYSSSLSQGIPVPTSLDLMNTPLNKRMEVNARILSVYPIKTIKLNGMTLPGPYPTPAQFKQLFNEGVAKYPTAPYYSYYRENSKKSNNQEGAKAQNLKGVKVPVVKFLSSPFGYTPIAGKSYGKETLIKSAKSNYGWNIGDCQLRPSATGFQWDNLDGMTFMGYPLWAILAYPYEDKYLIGGLGCYVVAPKSKEKYLNETFENLLRKNGYKKYEDENNEYWVKGNTLVQFYTYEYDSKFPGKVIMKIESRIVANQEIVDEFLYPDGWG